MMRAVLSMAFVMIMIAGAASADPIWDEKGKQIQPTRSSDFFSYKSQSKKYTENWTMMLRSERGHTVYLTFLRSNIGLVSGSSAVTVSLTLPGKMGKAYQYEYKASDFKEDKKAGSISIGPNSITRKKGEFHVVVKEKGMEMDLVLKNRVKGCKMWRGKMYLDEKKKDRWVQTFVHAPSAAVTGTMTLGGTKFKFEGDGFLDHLRQNVLGVDYATHWWVARFFHKDYTVAFFVFKTPKKLGSKIMSRLLVMDKKKMLLMTPDMKIMGDQKKDDPKGHKYDTRYTFSHRSDVLAISGTVTGKRLHDREAFLERLNAAQKAVVKVVAGNPVNYRQSATAELKLTFPGKQPIVLKGLAFMESIVLKGK